MQIVVNPDFPFKGYLVHQCHQRENRVKEIEIVQEEMQENLCPLEYVLITHCGCGECTDMARYENDCTMLSHDSRIIQTEVNVICPSRRLIRLTEVWIILDIT